MKVHKETVEMLIALYNKGHQILEDEFDAAHEGEDAREAAALDYMMSKEHVRFCGLFNNLDGEVRRELLALLQLGSGSATYSVADFEKLKAGATTGPETGDALFGTKQLPEQWLSALDRLGVK